MPQQNQDIPDPNNPNQNQDPNQQNPNPSPELETQIPVIQAPLINTVSQEEHNRQLEATHALYRQALQEAENGKLNAQRELENARTQHSPAPIPEDQLTPGQLIAREVGNQVAPLRTQFDSFLQTQQQQTYQTIKNNFRNLPQLAPFFTQLEPFIDTEMQGKAITVEGVQNAIATVIGRIQMQSALNPQPVIQNPVNNQQQNNQQQQQQQQPQNTRQQMLPPHLQPSAPPLPNRNGNGNLTPGGNQRYQLSELQARVARENKLTHDQYIDWSNETPENVVHSQIGITPRTT